MTEGASAGKLWTEDYVEQQLTDLESAVEPERATPLGGFHRAAAVLAYYDPNDLKPAPQPRTVQDSLPDLLSNSTVVYDPDDQPCLRLRTPVRQEVLQQLGGREAIETALQANSRRPHVPDQLMFEQYVAGTAPPLEKQGIEQLEGTLVAAEWLGGLVPVPKRSEVHNRIERERLVKPLRDLVGTSFSGRVTEVDRLRGYVGFLEAESFSDRIARGTRAVLRWQSKPPMVVHGLGGVGKSTLVSKFILDHVQGRRQGQQLPFVYLDFDRPSLQAEEPRSLLAEAVRQLGIQFPDLGGPGEQLRNAWLQSAATVTRSGRDTALERPVDEFAAFLECHRLREVIAALADPSGRPAWLLQSSDRPIFGDWDPLASINELQRRLSDHYRFARISAPEATATVTPFEVVRSVAMQVGWEHGDIPADSGMSSARYIQLLCEWLIARVASEEQPVVLVFSDWKSTFTSTETRNFLWLLAERSFARMPTNLRLLLVGEPREAPPYKWITTIFRTPDHADFSERPLLLVLDTFEEVQYRSSAFTREVFRLLHSLQKRLPRLRTVIVSRAPVTIRGQKVDDFPLGPLKTEDAVNFLIARGVTDTSLARTIVDQVGGSPLNLYLALQVVREQNVSIKGIEGLESRRFAFVRAQDDKLVLGQLYRRILGHLHNPDIRKLLSPGLVLRKVTPAVILDVLAEPTRVKVPDLAHAKRLFRELAREITFVSPGADGSLRFKPDLRRAMLPLLRRDEPARVQELQERAVAFYRSQSGSAARAELVYHLLWLGRPREELDAAWESGVESYLGEALEDLPPAARGYLASRLGLEYDSEGLKIASLEDWERSATLRAQELLSLGREEEALSVIREQPDHIAGGRLPLLEAQALVILQRWPEARTAVETGLAEVALNQDAMAVLQLSLLEARIDVVQQQPATADQRLDPKELVRRFQRLTEQFSGEPLVLRVGLHRLELLRSPVALAELASKFDRAELARVSTAADSFEANQLRQLLASFVPTIDRTRLERFPQLWRDLTGAIGDMHPEVVVLALELVQLGDLRSLAFGPAGSHVLDLVSQLQAWPPVTAEPPVHEYLARFLAQPVPEPREGTLLDRWEKNTAEVGLGWFEEGLLVLSREKELPPGVITALAGIYASFASARTERALYEEMEAEQPLRTTGL